MVVAGESFWAQALREVSAQAVRAGLGLLLDQGLKGEADRSPPADSCTCSCPSKEAIAIEIELRILSWVWLLLGVCAFLAAVVVALLLVLICRRDGGTSAALQAQGCRRFGRTNFQVTWFSCGTTTTSAGMKPC